MAVAMVVWESERFMQSLDIDAPADLGLALYPEFFMIRSPKASPREAWNDAVEKFQLGTGLLISNLLCRALVRQNTEITPQMRQSLVRSLEDEGARAPTSPPPKSRRYSQRLTATSIKSSRTRRWPTLHAPSAPRSNQSGTSGMNA